MKRKELSYFFGIIGEYISAIVLFFNLYLPIHRRYKTKFGEVDLICIKNKTVYFFEIKTRAKIENYENIVSNYQLKRISDAANYFMLKNRKFSDYSWQFDIIYITSSWPFYIRIKNIFDI